MVERNAAKRRARTKPAEPGKAVRRVRLSGWFGGCWRKLNCLDLHFVPRFLSRDFDSLISVSSYG